jgi:nicotinamidase-related amidase
MSPRFKVKADPYPWPFDGAVAVGRLALVVIDMQTDFCGPGGMLANVGLDLANVRAAIGPIRRVLDAARRVPDLLIIHTREGHRPELVDLPANKAWRDPSIGKAGPLGRMLVRGEKSWEIIPELAPLPGEIIVDKPGKGAFNATDLEHILRTCGVTHLILCGVTTDCCVHSTLREANDKGFECLILADGTGAVRREHHEASLSITRMANGIFGCTAWAEDTSAALAALISRPEEAVHG